MSIILERIKLYLDRKDISPRQFSLSIDRSSAYLSNSMKQGSSPSAEILSKISEVYPELNLRWLLTGDGEMILNREEIEINEKSFVGKHPIDKAIDKKIDIRLQRLEETLKQLVADLIDDEIERTKNEIEKNKKKA